MKSGRLILVIMALGAWCLLTAFFIFKMMATPYIGATFSADIKGRSAIVTSISKDSPADAAGLLKGDRVIRITNLESGKTYRFSGFEAIAGRHQLHSHEMSEAAGKAMVTTWEFMQSGPFELELHDGDRHRITPDKNRPVFKFPTKSFLAILGSQGVVLIAIGIFAFARPSMAVNFLALSGLGLSALSLTNSVTGARELVIPTELLSIIYPINGLGGILFTYGLLCVLWHFPRRISRVPLELILLAFGIFSFLSGYFRWFEFPLHTYQLPNLLPFPIAIIISFIQWQRTRNNPVERASVLWFMLSIYGTTTFVVLLYSIPIFLNSPPILGPHGATAVLALTYFGIAFGTLRVRLFDVHRVWWRAILWLAGGVFVFVADILLVALFDLEQIQAIPIALFVAGWMYFPVRQWVFRYFVGSEDIRVADHVSDLINAFTNLKEPESFNGHYVAFMRRVFDASEIGQKVDKAPQKPLLKNNGLSLQLADIIGEGGFELVGKSGGNRLFSARDISAAETFSTLVQNMFDARVRELDGLEEERERIVRDLHDDVGGRLLSMIYNASDEESKGEARSALTALKESLVVIENRQSVDFSVIWESIIEEEKKRAQDADLNFSVETNIETERVLSVRESVNLKRIIQEIVTNGIKYACAGEITLKVEVDHAGEIRLWSENQMDMVKPNVEAGYRRGIANMERRASDIGGVLTTEMLVDSNGTRKFLTQASIPIAGQAE